MKNRKKRTYCLGDIHGCMYELMCLLDKIKFDRKHDTLVSCGDLVEKGPHSKEIVEFFMELPNAIVAKGNHDESIVRFWKHQQEIKEGKKTKNPMKSFDDRIQTASSLNEDHIKWLDSLPMYSSFKVQNKKYIALHGGLFPGVHPKDMDRKLICRTRYIRKDKKDFWKLVYPGKEQEGDAFWADLYKGEFGFVFYGHQPSSGNVHRYPHAMGLDTGCVFGNKLTAYCVESEELFQVDARMQYAEVWREK